MFKLRQAKWLQRRWPPRRRAERPLRSLRRRKPKPTHCPHFLAGSSTVPEPAAQSRGGVWFQPWSGHHHPLWRGCFSLLNSHDQDHMSSDQPINRSGFFFSFFLSSCLNLEWKRNWKELNLPSSFCWTSFLIIYVLHESIIINIQKEVAGFIIRSYFTYTP